MKDICRVTELAVELGAAIIRCGGEVSRAEDSVQRMCMASGAKQVDVFAINSYISVCVGDHNGEKQMLSRRIRGRGTDLGRLEALNQLSREYCCGRIGIDEAESRLLRKEKEPSCLGVYATSVLVCAVFTLFFGGGIREGFVAGIAATVTVWLKRRAKNGFGNSVSLTFICSVASGTVGALLVLLGMASDYSVIAKGDIMLLVPGVSIVCAGRDIICGELLTGILGFVETLLIAIALAVGFALPELLINLLMV